MKGNASRMVSLFGIVALGVMMLTGLMSIAPSMRSAAQKYYVQQNVFDLRVLSTLGLSDQDIAAIAATPGVEAVMPVKTLDLEANWQGQEERIVVQLQALQQDPAADTDANMNRLVLRSGRMPQAANECVVHVMGYQAEIAEGTVLTLPEDTEGTKHKEYTVVGLVQDPQHISTDKESSTVGNGQLNYIAYVLDGELTADYYTACYIKAENADRYDNYSQEYQEAVDQVADRLEQISTAQCVQRREQLIDTANQKLAEARQTYDEQKAEVEQKFAEAEQQLDDAQKQLDDAKAQLDAGETELAKQKEALPDTMQNGADQLVDGEEQVLEFEEQLQQIQLLVNLKKVADPLLTYAQTALDNAQKALDEAEPADEEYIELRDALAKAQAAYDNINGQLQGYQAQLDEGKKQMYAQGLISSPNLDNDHRPLLALYEKIRAVKGVKKAFIGSGIRYDLFDRSPYLETVLKHHTSGRLKVAPEHTEDNVLKLMRKPPFALFERLNADFRRICDEEHLPYQLIPYFISSHPGCTEQDMKSLADKVLGRLHFNLEQVQDLTPTPMTLSSVMFWTGENPYTHERIYVARSQEEKRRQKSYFFGGRRPGPDRRKPVPDKRKPEVKGSAGHPGRKRPGKIR